MSFTKSNSDTKGYTLADNIRAAIYELSPKEKDVIYLRFGLDDGRERTLDEIGKMFGVTRERIRQIEVKAKKKLRKYINQKPSRRIINPHNIEDNTDVVINEFDNIKNEEKSTFKKSHNILKEVEEMCEYLEDENLFKSSQQEENKLVNSSNNNKIQNNDVKITNNENTIEETEQVVENIEIQDNTKENFIEEIKPKNFLRSTSLKDKTIHSLEKVGILTIDDIDNIDLQKLKINFDILPSVIEDLIQFMNSNGIQFKNKDLTKTGLYKYNLSPNIKSVLYSKGLLYIENLVEINILNVKRTNGVGAGLLDELLDFLIANNIPYFPKNESHSQRLKNTNLSLRVKNVLYDHGIFYLESLLNKNIEKLIIKHKITPAIAQEIREFLTPYSINKVEKQLQQETLKKNNSSDKENNKSIFGFNLKNIRHLFTRFEK